MSRFDPFPYPRNRLQDVDTALASTLEGLLEKEVASRRLELKEDYERLLAPALERLMCEIGLQRIFWPESSGGDGHNETRASYTVVAALEKVGYADTGLAFLAAHSLALQAAVTLEGSGNERLRDELAAAFCGTDKAVIVSFILPVFGEIGDDGALWKGRRFQVEASLENGVWALNGVSVRPTCSGADAGLFGAWCSVKGEDEPAFILVPGDARGLAREPEFLKTGLAASRNADITLENVKVPVGNCAWRGDAGLLRLLAWFYAGLTATAVGGLLAAHDILREWGDTRVIKGRGQVFKENPLTASLMAECAQDTAVDRLLAYDLAEMLAQPAVYGDGGSEGLFAMASMIANGVLRSADLCLHHVMELMASAGYAKEWQLERYWRDIKTLQCYLGGYELSKMTSARWFYGCRTL